MAKKLKQGSTILIKKPARYTAAKKKPAAKKVKSAVAVPIDFKAKYEEAQSNLRFLRSQIQAALRFIPRDQVPSENEYQERIKEVQLSTPMGYPVPMVAKEPVKFVTHEERTIALGKIEGVLGGAMDYANKNGGSETVFPFPFMRFVREE